MVFEKLGTLGRIAGSQEMADKINISAIATDLVTGVIAGLGAALIMSIFQSGVSRVLTKEKSLDTAAVRAADAMSEEVSGAPVKDRFKMRADTLLHYLTGAAVGAAYGLCCGNAPMLTAGRGLLFGGGVWAIADEGVIPALGLAPPVTEIGIKDHCFGLASHLIFGASLDFLRRQINSAISARAQ